MEFKKGQGLSMNVIIVAALAIIVLLIVGMIFSGKMKSFGGTMQSCTAQDGYCSTTTASPQCSAEYGYKDCKAACNNPTNSIILRGSDCEDGGAQSICCKEII